MQSEKTAVIWQTHYKYMKIDEEHLKEYDIQQSRIYMREVAAAVPHRVFRLNLAKYTALP